MKFEYYNRSALLASGLFLIAGAVSGQTTNPSQTGTSGGTSGGTSAGQTTGRAGHAGGSLNQGATADASTTSSAKGMDMRFAKEAAVGGLTEVELGKMATTKSSNDKVKQFGQKMVDDHSAANEELKTIAAKNGMTLPTSLDAKHKAVVDKMSAMSGDQFDKAYVADMVKDHAQDISLFQSEATSGTNSDLKSFAAKTLPTLQEHQRMIKEIKSGTKGSSGSSSSNR